LFPPRDQNEQKGEVGGEHLQRQMLRDTSGSFSGAKANA
jgi:hypothetical protein